MGFLLSLCRCARSSGIRAGEVGDFIRVRAGILAFVVSLAAASAARANILVNGGLESAVLPTQPDNLVYMSHTTNTGARGRGGTITSGGVDIVPTTYFQSSQGGYAVDLVGTPGVGVLSQTVTTVIGDHYQLTFDYSINPENLTGELGDTKRVKVT